VEGLERPPNVVLESDDGSADSWNRWIGRCRAVVLPIQPGMLSPSGIGTYLVAMALGKCVIMTSGPATIGLIDRGEAVLVPPRDVGALREAVDRVARDAGYRAEVALRGQQYALSLGGEERLRTDLLGQLQSLLALQEPH
jgi:glycosyltransferase involved in cell wall biosynthesis